jgi:hypothetical protein
MEIVEIPSLDPQTKVVISLGKVEEIQYTPSSKSRKAPHKYVHETKEEFLATDYTGKALFLYGKTFVAPSGWLIK